MGWRVTVFKAQSKSRYLNRARWCHKGDLTMCVCVDGAAVSAPQLSPAHTGWSRS